MDEHERREAMALARYTVISAYLAMDPPRGQRRQLLEQLASRRWQGPEGEPLQPTAETLRTWVRRYRKQGLAGLADRPRPPRGSSALPPEVIERAVALKKQVPERSLDRLLAILEKLDGLEPGSVSRSSLHRALQRRGVSRAPRRAPDPRDLDRFEADQPNELWQSDLLVGPWLPDPERPGKTRRAYLYAFLDDHSRLLLHGRFSFRGDLPALELVLRRAIQKYGQPQRAYYDNGQVYRSHHMKQILATLGVHRLIFTRPYRPQGHGKIEAFNRRVRRDFLAELKASPIRTLDELNEAFLAWVDVEYNDAVHSETGRSPLERWREGLDHARYADEERLRQAFLWREKRTADKSGLVSLLAVRYQVSPDLARRRVELRYDPEVLDDVEVWHDGRFRERVRPFQVQADRRPHPRGRRDESAATPATKSDAPPADWLGHLVERRSHERFVAPSPRQLAAEARARRQRVDDALVELLRERLDPAAFDEPTVRAFLDRFGPLDLDAAVQSLERHLDAGLRSDQHVQVFLDALRTDVLGGRR